MGNVLSWEEYFMGNALLIAKRSKDPNTQVGACIVNEENRVAGVGYNGMPNGNDIDFSWEREADWLDSKYPYVVHAELNAILNTEESLKGCSIYVSLFPCPECAKAIVQAGIKKVFYLSDKYDGTDGNTAAKKILDVCGVSYQQVKFSGPITIEG